MIEFYKKYFLDTYIHLALCVGLLTAYTYVSISFPMDFHYVITTMLGTLVIYNYHDVFSFDKRMFMNWLKSWMVLFPLFASVASILLICDKLMMIHIPILVSLVACFLYFRPINGREFSLRAITFFKIFLISLVFGMLSSTIPLMQAEYAWNEIAWLTLARMFFVGALAISFDIGDLLLDQKSNTSTLPSLMGNNKAKWMGSLLLVLAALIESYCAWSFMIDISALVTMFIVFFISWLLLLYSSPKHSKHFYLFTVDGMMCLAFIISLFY